MNDNTESGLCGVTSLIANTASQACCRGERQLGRPEVSRKDVIML